jgi:hypothetical protein
LQKHPFKQQKSPYSVTKEALRDRGYQPRQIKPQKSIPAQDKELEAIQKSDLNIKQLPILETIFFLCPIPGAHGL